MGLTNRSVGLFASDRELCFKDDENCRIIALAGNPNVGKSTVFNALTGLHQHTGNWSGKTVSNAVGRCRFGSKNDLLVDIPGTYSLSARSAEEEVARDFVFFGNHDAVIVVCDATVLERNLFLLLEILEVTRNTVLCVNLLDEAERKGITLDLSLISSRLGIPVVGTVAKRRKTLMKLVTAVDEVDKHTVMSSEKAVEYPEEIENALLILKPATDRLFGTLSRALGVKLLLGDQKTIKSAEKHFDICIDYDEQLSHTLKTAQSYLLHHGFDRDTLEKAVISATYTKAEAVCDGAVIKHGSGYSRNDRKIDRLLTGKYTAYPFMILLLALIFWITVTGANYPSGWLSSAFSVIENKLGGLMLRLGSPDWLYGILISGVFRVVSWVVSVMLPPMAIFFPLFTLLEDLGYLPRIAFNLDRPFSRCNSCGKQALTMSMGFGCNCAGIVGARIIDSPRERLLAILTNNFVPCNGRFPSMITLITLFFVGSIGGFTGSVVSALCLTCVILLGVVATFLSTFLLSKTLLKGMPSSFALELPPYRRPQIGKVLVRSCLDRTVFVLGRAIAVAAPAGAVIWLVANIDINGISLLGHTSSFLDPFGRLLGLDGVIIMAFILGFPANEIVLPLILMAYTCGNNLTEISDLVSIRQILTDNGWTTVTALNTIIFSLFHWPCSTALLTVKKETGSFKWMLVSAVLPTLFGATICLVINLLTKLF